MNCDTTEMPRNIITFSQYETLLLKCANFNRKYSKDG